MIQLRPEAKNPSSLQAAKAWYHPDRDLLHFFHDMMKTVVESITDDSRASNAAFLNQPGTRDEMDKLIVALGKMLDSIYNRETRPHYKQCWENSGLAELAGTKALDFFCRRMFVAVLGLYHQTYMFDENDEAVHNPEEFIETIRNSIKDSHPVTGDENAGVVKTW